MRLLTGLLDNLMTIGSSRAVEDQALRNAIAADQEWCDARASAARKLCDLDISEIACEAGTSLLDAIKTGDEALVGRVLIAAREAWLDRGADYSMDIDSTRPTAEDAARLVVLQAPVERAGGVA